MADDNPFAIAGAGQSSRPLFEPTGQSQAGAFDPFSFIGRIAGVPSTAERFGRVQAEALADLHGYIRQGLSPQQAINSFMGTPRGQAIFTSGDPNAMDFLDKFIKTATPPNPTAITTGPGQTSDIYQGGKPIGSRSVATEAVQSQNVPRFQTVPPGYTPGVQQGPNVTFTQPAPTTEQQNVNVPKFHQGVPGGQPMIQTGSDVNRVGPPVPPTDVQTFQHFTRNLPPHVVQELERLHALPADQRPAALERALRMRVASGEITQEQMNWAMTVQIQPAFNAYGDRIGTQFIDPAVPSHSILVPGMLPGTGGTKNAPAAPNPVTQPQQPGAQPPGAPAQTQPQAPQPGPQAPQTQQQTQAPQADPNAGMFDAAGLAAGAYNIGVNIAQGAFPSLQTPTSEAQARAANKIDHLRQAVVNMQENSPRLKAVAGAMLDLVPARGLTSQSAPTATWQGIQLYDKVQEQKREAQLLRMDLSKPQKLRSQAEEDLRHLDAVEQALPRRETMIQSLQAMAQGKEGLTLPAAAKELLGLGKGAARETKQELSQPDVKQSKDLLTNIGRETNTANLVKLWDQYKGKPGNELVLQAIRNRLIQLQPPKTDNQGRPSGFLGTPGQGAQ